jgi:hypothetical protein
MAIQIDPALNLMPRHTQSRMSEELRFGGYPNGRGPISEAVMPLNNVLIERAQRIRTMEGIAQRQAAAIERKDAALWAALDALEGADRIDTDMRDAITSIKEALK